MVPLKRVEKEMKECVKCGVCRAHCPVFTELGREPAVARGKVALARAILSGRIKPDARTYADMSKCLLCGNCVQKCPNDVPTDEIVVAARETLAQLRGLTSFHKALRQILKNRVIMRIGAFIAAIVSPLVMRKVPGSSGLRLRFPLPFISGGRFIPKIASKPFMSRHPVIIPGGAEKPRILFFAGCMINFIYPEVGDAAVALLGGVGCTVIIPEEQQCCGLPAMSGGDVATFRELAEKNLAALEKYQADYIVTACASCGGALHGYYPAVIGKAYPELAGRCRAVAAKAVDAVSLLKILGFKPGKGVADAGIRMTYHDPCHLRRRNSTKEPRELLRGVPGGVFVEMEGADACCGLGGTFNLYHYGTSMAINARKSAAILKSGAEIVLTGCPGCMLQLNDGLQQKGIKTRVAHILELLARTVR
ncbi:MAG: (Fe-S)-binding protein [Deltaproteobacteria bacterium]